MEIEREEYERRRPALVARADGHYAVVCGTRVLGPFATFSAAYRGGIKSFGAVPMLIERVAARDRASFVPTLATAVSNGVFRCQSSI